MTCSNTRLIIERNYNPYHLKRLSIKQGWLCYTDNGQVLDFETIGRLLKFVSGIHSRFKTTPMMLSLCFPRMKAVDKLTIQVLESVVYSLIVDYGHKVIIEIELERQIHSEGFTYTPLQFLGRKNYDLLKFVQYFEGNTQINHYRKVIPKGWTFDGKLGDIIFPDIFQTLSNAIDDKYIKETLAEVVTELVNNANEHNDSDCLLDLDISNEYHRKDDSSGVYIGVNLSLISFSQQSVSEHLSRKIESKNYSGERYGIVADAYEFHKNFFGEDYTPRDFYMTAAFQNKISGRLSYDDSGGTGLTKLIKTLEEYSDSHECYMVSDGRAMFFSHDLLDYDDDGWVGFNKEKDFQHKPPEPGVFKTSPIVIPGIGYNLNFVYKKE